MGDDGGMDEVEAGAGEVGEEETGGEAGGGEGAAEEAAEARAVDEVRELGDTAVAGRSGERLSLLVSQWSA